MMLRFYFYFLFLGLLFVQGYPCLGALLAFYVLVALLFPVWHFMHLLVLLVHLHLVLAVSQIN